MSILSTIGIGIVVVAVLIVVWLVVNYQPTHGLWEKEYAVRNFEPLIDLIKQYLNHEAYGQNATPKAVTPTPVPTPTPTAPNPNFQYLPQKAYVQPFAPESGIPANSIPLTAVPTVVPAPVQQQATTGGFDSSSIMAIISAILGGGALLKSKMVGDKTNQVEGITKQSLSSILQDKEAIAELAKFAFSSNPEAANKLDNAPCIKLDTLEKQKVDFADKAAKA